MEVVHYNRINPAAKVFKIFLSKADLSRHAIAARWVMRNVHEVLRQKELELTRVRQEVESLRCVAPMLTEPQGNQITVSESELRQKNRWPLHIEELPPESFG